MSIKAGTLHFTTESLDVTARQQYRELVLRQLVADRDRLPPDWLTSAITRITEAGNQDPVISQLAHDILGEHQPPPEHRQATGD